MSTLHEDGSFTDDSGRTWRVHEAGECAGPTCMIHNPSDHSMRDFPLVLRTDPFRYAFPERICPHGVGHPDPDHMKFAETVMDSERARAEGVHGCDGCCSPKHRVAVQAVHTDPLHQGV